MFPQCHEEPAGLRANVTTSDFSKPRDPGRVVRKNIHTTAAGLGNSTEPCATAARQVTRCAGATTGVAGPQPHPCGRGSVRTCSALNCTSRVQPGSSRAVGASPRSRTSLASSSDRVRSRNDRRSEASTAPLRARLCQDMLGVKADVSGATGSHGAAGESLRSRWRVTSDAGTRTSLASSSDPVRSRNDRRSGASTAPLRARLCLRMLGLELHVPGTTYALRLDRVRCRRRSPRRPSTPTAETR